MTDVQVFYISHVDGRWRIMCRHCHAYVTYTTPLPLPSKKWLYRWQRTHADKCRPFLEVIAEAEQALSQADQNTEDQ